MGAGHNESVDWWSLGVLVFQFLSGGCPFDDKDPDKIYDNILLGRIKWPVQPGQPGQPETADNVGVGAGVGGGAAEPGADQRASANLGADGDVGGGGDGAGTGLGGAVSDGAARGAAYGEPPTSNMPQQTIPIDPVEPASAEPAVPLISPIAKDLIERLLCFQPMERLGARGATEVKDHVFFDGVQWDSLYRTSAPFKPMVRDVLRDGSAEPSAEISDPAFNSQHFEAHFKDGNNSRSPQRDGHGGVIGMNEPESPSGMVSVDSNGRGFSTDRSYTEFSFYG